MTDGDTPQGAPVPPTPFPVRAGFGVVACLAVCLVSLACASSSVGAVDTGAAGVDRDGVDAGDPGTAQLRMQPFTGDYRVRIESERLDEEGGVLEAREQEATLRLAVGPDVVSGPGEVTVTVESVSPARAPIQRSYPADSLGGHPVNEWRGERWVAPLVPMIVFPGEPVGPGDEWTTRRTVLLTSSELEGGSTIRYRVESVDGDRVRLSFSGRASGNRRVEQGEMGTGRPVILAASSRTRGSATVHRRTGQVLQMAHTDELTVAAEPLDARDADGSAREILQRLRMRVVVERSDTP